VSALEQGAASGEDVEARVAALEKSGVSDLRIANIEKVVASYEDWQPGVEGTLDDMKLAVRKLNKYLERVVIDSPPSKSDSIFKLPESASARPSAGFTADGPHGHREDPRHREDGFGSVTTLAHPPVKGVFHSLPLLPAIPSHACLVVVLVQDILVLVMQELANYLSFLFQFLMEIILDIGYVGWRITLICMG
jgi:hypothetical protein